MNQVKSLILLIVGIALLSACNKDKTIVSVSGIVSDGTNGIEAVIVTAYNIDGTVAGTTTSTAGGSYSIDAQKNATIRFVKGGFRSTEKTLTDNKEQTVDVTLLVDGFNATYFLTAGNQITNPDFLTGSITPNNTNFGTLSIVPTAWYTTVNYKGAVNPVGTSWYNGWSFYSRIVAGITTSATLPTAGKPVKNITGAWMDAAADTVRWVKDTVYVLNGFVYVNDGQVLMIEAGTVVQGKAGEGSNASALVITRGAKIMAEGTNSNPIVFTYEGDNGGTEATQRGRWGGLIVLGKASLNSTPGSTQVEGIPTTESRGLYGGTIDTDNSGVLRYVSIRHGGSNIGADNEINGLTLGGVGSGTTIEYLEVVGNSDDGIEWFGGTVNAKWIISAFNADDALDYDEGYRGNNQFIIVHQSADDADRGGEHDGGTNPETAMPYATPKFYNATFIGNQDSRTLTFRDNAGGEYHNSIFVGFGRGIDIEDLIGQDQDSYKQWLDGNLKLENNWFFSIGTTTTGSGIFKTSN